MNAVKAGSVAPPPTGMASSESNRLPSTAAKQGDGLWHVAKRLLGDGASDQQVGNLMNRLMNLNPDAKAKGGKLNLGETVYYPAEFDPKAKAAPEAEAKAPAPAADGDRFEPTKQEAKPVETQPQPPPPVDLSDAKQLEDLKNKVVELHKENQELKGKGSADAAKAEAPPAVESEKARPNTVEQTWIDHAKEQRGGGSAVDAAPPGSVESKDFKKDYYGKFTQTDLDAAKLKTTISELESRLQSETSRLKLLEQEESGLKGGASFEPRLKEIEAEKKVVQANIDELMSGISSLGDRLKTLQGGSGAEKPAAADGSNGIPGAVDGQKWWNGQLHGVKPNAPAEPTEVPSAPAAAADLATQIKETSAALSELQAQLDTKQGEVDRLAKAVTDQSSLTNGPTKEALQGQLDEAKNAVADITPKVEFLKSKLGAMQGLAESETLLADAKSELDKARTERNRVSGREPEKRPDLAPLESKVSGLEGAVKTYRAELDNMNKSATTSDAKPAEGATKSERTREVVQSEYDVAKAEHSALAAANHSPTESKAEIAAKKRRNELAEELKKFDAASTSANAQTSEPKKVDFTANSPAGNVPELKILESVPSNFTRAGAASSFSDDMKARNPITGLKS